MDQFELQGAETVSQIHRIQAVRRSKFRRHHVGIAYGDPEKGGFVT